VSRSTRRTSHRHTELPASPRHEAPKSLKLSEPRPCDKPKEEDPDHAPPRESGDFHQGRLDQSQEREGPHIHHYHPCRFAPPHVLARRLLLEAHDSESMGNEGRAQAESSRRISVDARLVAPLGPEGRSWVRVTTPRVARAPEWSSAASHGSPRRQRDSLPWDQVFQPPMPLLGPPTPPLWWASADRSALHGASG
jgi:hypothetical protein